MASFAEQGNNDSTTYILWMHIKFLRILLAFTLYLLSSPGAHIRHCTDFVQIKWYFLHVNDAYSWTRRSHDTDAVLCHLAEISLLKRYPAIECFSLDDCSGPTIWCALSLHCFYSAMLTSLNKRLLSYMMVFIMMENIVWFLTRMFCKTKNFFIILLNSTFPVLFLFLEH